MNYLTDPLAALFIWSFKSILEPLGELPGLINPNNVFVIIMAVGLAYWLRVQAKYNRKAKEEGGLK